MSARLHAVWDGPADARVLVLGPSLGTDVGLFDAQVSQFAGPFRVLRYDLRGHGSSEVVPGPCTVADLAEDVLHMLDREGVGRFSYAGVSIGDAIGQQLAITAPERVERLALLATAAQSRRALVRGTGAASTRGWDRVPRAVADRPLVHRRLGRGAAPRG